MRSALTEHVKKNGSSFSIEMIRIVNGYADRETERERERERARESQNKSRDSEHMIH